MPRAAGELSRSEPENPAIHVAAGVLRDPAGRILLSRRKPGTHLAGAWEFPGGKLEAGETAELALGRELEEELGIIPVASHPLLSLTHHYPDKSVTLHFRAVDDWSGKPRSMEGQAIRWVLPTGMAGLDMPAADRPVVRVLGLDSRYAITPDPSDVGGVEALVVHWKGLLAAGFRLLQLRAPGLGPEELAALARLCGPLAREAGARWFVNASPALARDVGADGVHLTTRRLLAADGELAAGDLLVAASCHSPAELLRAGRLGVDFATLSPVAATQSHPGKSGLGWRMFSRWSQDSPVPVFALGGVVPDDLDSARQAGAYGVAGIRGFFP